MARRYDGRTTTFSPEGRLFQVEYAMESISNSGAAVGVLAKDGVVLATEKRVTSKLLDTGAVGCRKEKMFQLDEHILCARRHGYDSCGRGGPDRRRQHPHEPVPALSQQTRGEGPAGRAWAGGGENTAAAPKKLQKELQTAH